MGYLYRNNYRPITFEELPEAYLYKKPIFITFDDGYDDNYTIVYPILKKYHFHATIFMIAGAIGNSHYLKASEIRAMSDLVDIQSHTLTHPDLTKLNQGRLNYELAESKKQLEALTNKKVIALAYPSGRYNNLVLDVTRRYYRYAVITVRGSYHYGDNLYLIRRIPIPRSLSLKMFVERLNCER